MSNATYQERRGQIENYFDRTAAAAWAKLTSDAPVGRIRATVRAGRDRMRATLLSWLTEDLSGKRILDAGCGTGALAVEAARRGAPLPPLVRQCRSQRPGCACRSSPQSARTAGWHAYGRARRARWRGCGLPVHPKSAWPRPQRPCDRNSFRSGRVVPGRSRYSWCLPQSKPNRSKISRSFMGTAL